MDWAQCDSQDDVDAAVANGKGVDLSGDGTFRIDSDVWVRVLSGRPTLLTHGSSSPTVEAYGSSSPRVLTYGSSSPTVLTYGSSSPMVETHDSSSPRVLTHDSSSPRVLTYGSSRVSGKVGRWSSCVVLRSHGYMGTVDIDGASTGRAIGVEAK